MPSTGAAALIGKKLKESTKMYQFLESDAQTKKKKASDGKNKKQKQRAAGTFHVYESYRTNGRSLSSFMIEGRGQESPVLLYLERNFGLVLPKNVSAPSN